MKLCCLRASVVNRNADENVVWVGLGVFHEHVEISIGVKDSSVKQFVFELFAGAPFIGFHQVAIRELRLWILVEKLHVGVRRSAIEVEVIFLDVLAMIAFAVGETEQPFFQDWVTAVPQSECEAELLLVIGDPGQTIFTPAVSPRTRLIMTEVVPGIPVLAVVFANRAPLPLTQIRPPLLPRYTRFPRIIQAPLFFGFNVRDGRLRTRFHGGDFLHSHARRRSFLMTLAEIPVRWRADGIKCYKKSHWQDARGATQVPLKPESEIRQVPAGPESAEGGETERQRCRQRGRMVFLGVFAQNDERRGS